MGQAHGCGWNRPRNGSLRWGWLEEIVLRAGAKRVVYGSDYPILDFAYELGRVWHSRLSPEEKALVLGGNARRLLKHGSVHG